MVQFSEAFEREYANRMADAQMASEAYREKYERESEKKVKLGQKLKSSTKQNMVQEKTDFHSWTLSIIQLHLMIG